jgi:hypothetical protein
MFPALAAPAAAGGGSGMGGMAGSPGPAMQTLHLPTLAFVFALLLAGYAVRDLDLLSGPAAVGGRYTLIGAGIAPAGAGAGAGAGAALAAASALAGTTAAAAAPAAAGGGQATAPWPGQSEPEAAAPASGDTTGGPGLARRLALTPGLETACRIAMGVTMAFMLIIMI